MAKKLRIRQLLKIYRWAKGVDLVQGFDVPFYPGKPWVEVAYFDNGREISMETYAYCKATAEKLRAKLLISES